MNENCRTSLQQDAEFHESDQKNKYAADWCEFRDFTLLPAMGHLQWGQALIPALFA